MATRKDLMHMIPLYLMITICMILLALYTDRSVTTLAEDRPIAWTKTVIVDPGHGGVDGGATSCTGVLESQFNLDISLRLHDVLHLLGSRSVLTRTVDESIHTEGSTIATRKVSDLKQRVKIANQTPGAVFISIHQNYYPDSQCFGPQVFFAPTDGSHAIAMELQHLLLQTLDPHSHRQAKKADGIYLMQHVTCPAVLVECGFISNPQEEAKLRTKEYQIQLCCVIATTLSQTIYNT